MSSIQVSLLREAYRFLSFLRPHRAAPYPGHPIPVRYLGEERDIRSEVCASEPIPARIWSYWDSEKPDALVDQCVANWRAHNPGFDVQVVNSQNIGTHIPLDDIPPGFERLHPTKRSDWIRLYLVSRYGGYWLDASILLTCSLNWLEAQRCVQSAEVVGFYLDGYTRDAAFPVVESWAFGAPANSPFVTAWQQEFHCALIEVGTESYLDALRSREDGETVLQGIADPSYLLIHVAAQQVLRRSNGFRLALFKAEESAYFYQKALAWKWYWLYARLCLVHSEPVPAPLVKLRGGERRHFAEIFAKQGGPSRGSIWQRACEVSANSNADDVPALADDVAGQAS